MSSQDILEDEHKITDAFCSSLFQIMSLKVLGVLLCAFRVNRAETCHEMIWSRSSRDSQEYTQRTEADSIPGRCIFLYVFLQANVSPKKRTFVHLISEFYHVMVSCVTHSCTLAILIFQFNDSRIMDYPDTFHRKRTLGL